MKRALLFWALFLIVVLAFWAPILRPGQLVFSDLDFGSSSARYLESMTSIWNYRWSTPTLFNLPRLLIVLPFYGLSSIGNYSGELFLKSFILTLFWVSGFSFYKLARAVLQILEPRSIETPYTPILLVGMVCYSLNPWTVIRVQHIYLLVGYAFFPLALYYGGLIFTTEYSHFRRKLRPLVGFVVTFSLTSISQHYFIFLIFTLMPLVVGSSILACYRAGHANRLANLRMTVITVGFTGLLIAGVNFFWLGTYLVGLIRGVLPSQLNINTPLTVDLFSRNASLQNVFYGISYWWPMFDLQRIPIAFWVMGGGLLLIAGSALKYIRRPIMMIIAGSTLLIATLATGTNLEGLRGLYLTLVFQLGTVVGTVFRDPNKLVGVLQLQIALLVVIGGWGLNSALANHRPTWLRWVANWQRLVALAGLLCWLGYMVPWRDIYVSGFYAPPNLPPDYGSLRDFLKATVGPNERVLYLPISYSMLDSVTGYTSPYWNIQPRPQGDLQRATSDYHIFDTPVNTLFQNEGSDSSVEGFYNVVQSALDSQDTSHLSALLATANIRYLVYRVEYPNQSSRQQKNLKALERSDLTAIYQNDIMHVFRVDLPQSTVSTDFPLIFTPYGYSHLGRYSLIPALNPGGAGVVFTQQTPGIQPSMIYDDSYVETTDSDSLRLSMAPRTALMFPVDFIQSNTAWNAAYAQKLDFVEALKRQGLGDLPYDFDLHGGVVYSEQNIGLSSAIPKNGGTRFIGPEDVVDQRFPIQPTDPTTITRRRVSSSAVQFHLEGDQSSTSWRTLQTPRIAITPRTVFRVSYRLSGSNVEQPHLKLIVYDKNGQELQVAYFVPKTTGATFTDLSTVGTMITADGAVNARIELLTHLAIPTQSAELTLDSFEMTDLSDFQIPFVFNMARSQSLTQQGTLYARVLKSAKGGTLQIDVAGVSYSAVTQQESGPKFTWVRLGKATLPAGMVPFTMTNRSGFNAINAVAFLTDDEEAVLDSELPQALGRASVFVTLNAITDFSLKSGNAARIAVPPWASGPTLTTRHSILETPLEVLKSAKYRAQITGLIPNTQSHITLLLRDNQQQLLTRATIDRSTSNHIDLGWLETGTYTLSLALDADSPSLVTGAMWHILGNDTLDKLKIGTDSLSVSYQPHSDADWVILTSGEFPVVPQTTVRLQTEIRSSNLANRHMKARLLDAQHQELSVIYFQEALGLPNNSNTWQQYLEDIVVPDSARYVEWQILGKADPSLPALLDLQRLSATQSVDMVQFNQLTVYEDGHLPFFANRSTDRLSNIQANPAKPQSDPTKFILNSGVTHHTVAWLQSPSPLWQLTVQGKVYPGYPLNGVSTVFLPDGSGQATIETSLDGIYAWGRILLVVTLGLLVLCLWFGRES